MSTEKRHAPKVWRAWVVLAAIAIAVSLSASVHRLYASAPGCADLKCTSNDYCKQQRCDICHGDGRCAWIAEP